MKNPFDTAEMALGYARSRPSVHPRIVDLAARDLHTPVERALDIGCGAGLSTLAIASLARERYGLEPVQSMLPFAPAIAPGAHFLAGSAERLPFREDTVDLLTAAGSLNYVNLEAFFQEATRVLKPTGHLLVYDFKTARRFAGTDAVRDPLDNWFDEFLRRYPPVVSPKVQPLDPDSLAQRATGFTRFQSESPQIALELDPGFYMEYLLTGTNVAQAVTQGADLNGIRVWLQQTLNPIWQGQRRTVLFDAYWILLVPLRRGSLFS